MSRRAYAGGLIVVNQSSADGHLDDDDIRDLARKIIETAPTLLYIYDLVERRNIYAGPQILPMTGRASAVYQNMQQDVMQAIIHVADLDRVGAHHAAIRAGTIEPPFEIEYRISRGDGGWLWMHSREVVHARDAAGLPTQILGAALDITHRREAEATRDILIEELDHRVKNAFAIAQAVASLTLRRHCEPAQFEVFEARLAALAGAQASIHPNQWHSAVLADVVSHALSPFDADRDGRLHLPGKAAGECQIAAADAPMLALILHELATNATKYGAWSVDGGVVTIDWCRSGSAVLLTWQEAGGPAVAAPAHRGFGTGLIRNGLRGRPAAVIDYAPAGLCVTLSIGQPRIAA